MPVVFAILAVACALWGLVYARRGSMAVGCAAFVIVGYVLGHEFWHARVGPVPVTLDRAIFAGVIALAFIQWRSGTLRVRKGVGSDWLLGTLLLIMTASALIAGAPSVVSHEGTVWGRLAFSFGLPGLLYWIASQTAPTKREWKIVLTMFVVLGTYLGITAMMEVAGKWSLVFPRYIADPNLGIHFGRARGPSLNSASLGIFLTSCLWCGWLLLPQMRQRWQQLAILAVLPLMALGVLLTYTRSTWIGLAASGLVVALVQMPRRWRPTALLAAVVGGVLVAGVSWSYIVGLEREGTAAESHHSVDQRQSFAYVSWQMFKDYPIFGVGFGRFYDRKLPYLSDRRQEVELESIRLLHHHNTLLSLLTELGMVGLAVFLALLAAWARYARMLASDEAGEAWRRGQGVLMLAILVNYVCSALFHDLALVPPLQWLLMLFAGFATCAWTESRVATNGLRTAIGTACGSRVVVDGHARPTNPGWAPLR